MTDNTQSLLEALQVARTQKPQLASIIDLHCALLEAGMHVTLPSLPPLPAVEAANQALAAGHPLITLAALPLDSPAVMHLAAETCDITARYRPELAGDLAAIRRHLAGNGSQGEEAIPSDLLIFVLNQAWRPLLRAWAERMAEVVSITDWRRPVCPFCGGPPDLGALDTNTGTRYLLCSRCDAEWAFSRLACPFCGDTRRQAYFPGENEQHRLYVCDACRRYLKVVDLRQTWRAVRLPVERVLTVGMDLAARQAGYT